MSEPRKHTMTVGEWIDVYRDFVRSVTPDTIILESPEGVFQHVRLSGKVCDFCSAPGPLNLYSSKSFAMVKDQFADGTVTNVFEGDWLACVPCTELIEANDRSGLHTRGLDAMVKRHFGLVKGMVSEGELRKKLSPEVKRLQEGFWAAHAATNVPTGADDERLDLYRQQYAPLCCFLCTQNSGHAVRVEFATPGGLPDDLRTIIDGFRDKTGALHLCARCARYVPTSPGLKTNCSTAFRHLFNDIVKDSWLTSLPGGQREGVIGLLRLLHGMYALGLVGETDLVPSVACFIALATEYPFLLLPSAVPGMLNVFTRALSRDAYVTAIPLDRDLMILSDFAVRVKGQGHGRAALRRVLDVADRYGVRLMGIVESHTTFGEAQGAIPKPALVEWYKRLGFEVVAEVDGEIVVERKPVLITA